MLHSCARFALLADRSHFRQMGQSFRRGGSPWETTDVVTLAVVVLVIAAVIWLLVRVFGLQNRASYYSPGALFRELCRAHRLSWATRRLLRQLARSQRLSQPARLFVEPERFDPTRLHPMLASRRDQVEDLHNQLFGRPFERVA